jgi:hypothetical protein
MILASRQTTKKHRRGKQERKQERKQNRHTKKQTTGKNKQVGFKKLPTLQDSIQNHLEDSKH